MAKYVNKGHNLDYVNGTGSDIAAGDILTIGDLVGVAGTDIPDGELGSVAVHGVFMMPITSEAITVGTKVYLTSAGKITATEGSNTPAGYCAISCTATDTEVAVKLLG